MFSRETTEDSWSVTQGGQNAKFNEQNKMIKQLLKAQDVRIDGYYTSLVAVKNQTFWDDYQQIYVDFGVNSEAKIKNRVLFIQSVANQDLMNTNTTPADCIKHPDPQGYFLFDFSCQPPVPLV